LRRLLLRCGDLVPEILHVVVGAVLEHRLGRLMRICPLLSRRLPAGAAEDRRNDHQQCRTEIEQRLQVLPEHALRFPLLAAQLGFVR
jgi:hypothetical protein